ncbi:MAG TPA: FkbM family methyltransferase [Gaiellaceae bacterium]
MHTDVGSLLILAADEVMRPLIARTSDWEADEAALFRAQIKPAATVIDVGAHVGYYTLLAARAVGRRGHVVAVEPDPTNAALLRENIRRNRLRNVTVIEAAAWQETTQLALRRDPVNTGDHRVTAAASENAVALTIEGVALDELLGTHSVALIKVDAQGADHIALAGMHQTLARCRPVVFAEFWPHGIREVGDDPAGVIDSYRALGFRLTMPGLQVDFEHWSADDFVRAAEALPGGFGTLVLRPCTTD